MISTPDADVRDIVRQLLGEPVEVLDARPHAMQSSCTLTELAVRERGGRRYELVLKELSTASRHPGPVFLHDPRREITAYRLLDGRDLGLPRLLGSHADPARGHYRLLLERIEGIPLWQSGEPRDWCGAAEWLADLHALAPVPRPAAWLRYDAAYYGRWLGRAHSFAPAAGVAALAPAYEEAVERLAAAERVLVHGDFYPSNVIVAPARRRGVCPLDLELAGVGAAALDLAALTTGLPARLATMVLDAYRARRGLAADGELERLVVCGRLHLAVRWLGWLPAWEPPEHQRFDWAAEAHAAAAALEAGR